MALINKIRERSGVAVGVVAIALLLFIVGGDLFSGQSSLFGGQDNTVGEIAGERIDLQEFQKQLDVANANYESQSGRSASEQEKASIREQVWQKLINDIAFKKEYEALGIKVTDDELVDMVQGNNPHPAIVQQFTNPQTQQFDKSQVINYLKGLKSMPVAQQQSWANFEQSLVQDRIRTKYENLLAKSVYTTAAEAKKDYQAQTAKADVRYLYVPFYAINDTTKKVSDSQLNDYFNAHKAEFQGFDSRSFQYVVMPVTPTKQDSSFFYNEIKALAKGLAAAANDSAYAVMNSDTPVKYSRSINEMSDALKSSIGSFQVGGVYGPFKDGSTYSVYKYKGSKSDKDSVRASHILVADQAKAQSLLDQIKAGADFATLAKENGTDGTKDKGGDLGYFGRGAMVPTFEQAAFSNSGLVPTLVQTQFGYHIIKVTGVKNSTYHQLATISKTIAPSEETKNTAYQKAEALRDACKSKEDLEAAVKKDGKLVLLTADKITPEASNFNTIREGREVVLWAFNKDTEVGNVSSKVFELGDQYVVAALTNATDKDNPKAQDFKDAITLKVRNESKSADIMKKLGSLSGTLEEVAQKYGAGALVETASGITMATGMLNTAGFDPTALGKIFGSKVGKRTKPFVGENGVFISEVINMVAAPEIADYTLYKVSAQQKSTQSSSYLVNEAVKEASKITDNRARFF